MIPRPWVVVLAAGGSRRFGSAKLLAQIGKESLLRRAARAALATEPPGCVVVLGADSSRLRRELSGLPVRAVVNRRWRRGLSSSLAAGIDALPRSARAALVFLADQGALGPGDLALASAAWQNDPTRIVASLADGVLGPPAVFPRKVFAALRRLRGDQGAREIVRDPARAVVGIELQRASVDVDRRGDLTKIRRMRGRA
jgi:CTP:molybdopterin cytidylyltransferase MocA